MRDMRGKYSYFLMTFAAFAVLYNDAANAMQAHHRRPEAQPSSFGPPPRQGQAPRPTPQQAPQQTAARSAPAASAFAPPQNNWYVGVSGALNMASWEMENSGYGNTESDRVSMEPMIGFGVSVGRTLPQNWRVELAVGTFGEYSDSNANVTFNHSAHYAMMNVVRSSEQTEWGALYIGFGAGAVVSNTQMSYGGGPYDAATDGGVSPVGAVMFGWEKHLARNTVLNIGYRFAAYQGPNGTLGGIMTNTGVWNGAWDMGFVMNNSLEMGLRFLF